MIDCQRFMFSSAITTVRIAYTLMICLIVINHLFFFVFLSFLRNFLSQCNGCAWIELCLADINLDFTLVRYMRSPRDHWSQWFIQWFKISGRQRVVGIPLCTIVYGRNRTIKKNLIWRRINGTVSKRVFNTQKEEICKVFGMLWLLFCCCRFSALSVCAEEDFGSAHENSCKNKHKNRWGNTAH